MAIESIARRLLDWIDLDDEEARELLPASLGEQLPETAGREPEHAPEDAADATARPETATIDRPAETAPTPADGGRSRWRRVGPYLLGLLAALTAFGVVLAAVSVVRGWIEELRVGYTPMDETGEKPTAPAEDAASAPDDRPAVPVDRSPQDDGDILAAIGGLAFHAVVDRIVTEPSDPGEGTTIPVESEE